MIDVDAAVSAAFVRVIGKDPALAPMRPPEKTIPFAVLKEELSAGYGVEDIAVKHDVDADHVRCMVAVLRSSNRLHLIYPRKGKRFKPSFFAWIRKGKAQ